MLRIQRHVPVNKPDDFSISTSDQLVEQFHSVTAMVALVMVVMSSIGLLVGGIGVMNIMLVSVTERTREIGIRKAIGARRADIVLQFLTEAVVLTGLGGLIGMTFGWTVSLACRLSVSGASHGSSLVGGGAWAWWFRWRSGCSLGFGRRIRLRAWIPWWRCATNKFSSGWESFRALWGRPLVCVGHPWTRRSLTDSASFKPSTPTGASAADQGVRPTISACVAASHS